MHNRFLIVDDDKDFLRQLRVTFSDQGYWVVAASNGEEALEELKKQEVDLVVLDIQMPGMSGLEVLTYIKKRYPETLVLMLTGHGEYKSQAESLGCDGFLEKPVSYKVLTDTVLSILKKKDYTEVKELSFQHKFMQAKKGDIIADILLLGMKSYYTDRLTGFLEKRQDAHFRIHIPEDIQQALDFQEIFYADIVLVDLSTFKEPRETIAKLQAADKPPKAYIFYPKNRIDGNGEVEPLVTSLKGRVWDAQGYGRQDLESLFELLKTMALEYGLVK